MVQIAYPAGGAGTIRNPATIHIGLAGGRNRISVNIIICKLRETGINTENIVV